jgi:hypothetical protein
MGKSIRRAVTHRLYFVKPKENANADELAERLICLELVDEVLITEGDCGFIVKARLVNGKEPTDVASYISKNIGSRYGKVVSHCEYKK